VTAALSAACGGSNERVRDVASAYEQTRSTSASFATVTDSAEIRDVRAIHRSRCGSCHVPVEPGTHTRAELETAFTKHRTRVKMNDAEWSSMIDYLASDSANAKGPAISASK
jgi:hypothetical protein